MMKQGLESVDVVLVQVELVDKRSGSIGSDE